MASFSFHLFKHTTLAITLVLIYTLIPHSLFAQHKISLQKYETANVKLVFLDKNISYLVPHSVRSFENALTFHKLFWDYKPSGPTNILFNDFGDIGNGGTNVIPWNFLNIGVAPFDYTFSVVPSNERMQWLMSHELTHQVMCDKASRTDRTYRAILGGKTAADNRDPLSLVYSYFTTPRWYSPRWFHEGIAVFMETWMSGGIGRVLGGYDEMVFRSMVHDSAYFYNVIGLETEGTTVDFQVGVNSYLYGTRFVSYLAYQYGIPKLKSFYARTDTSRRFYASQFKEVYGCNIQKEWDKWIAWERDFQGKNLKKLAEFPTSDYRKITTKALGSVSRQYYIKSTNQVVAAVNYPGSLAHLALFDLADGKQTRVAAIPSPGLYYVTSLAYDDSLKTVFVSTHNHDWRGLQSIDLQTGKSTKLVQYSRCGNLVINPKDHSLWGIQSMSGRNSLVRFEPPYQKSQSLYTLPYGQDLTDPDISADGKMLSATVSDVTGRQQLVIFKIADLLAGKQVFEEIYVFEDNSAANFVFSPDDKYLYGTSYYTGVSNIFRIAIDTKKVEILTNAETGFFRPLPISADSMLMFEYTNKGMLAGVMHIDTLANVNAIDYLGQLVYEKNPEVASWILPPPSKVNLDSLHVTEKPYGVVKGLQFAGAYPIVQGYKDYIAPGYRINFMDPMGLNSFVFKFSVSPYENLETKQQFHLAAEYNYWNWSFSGNYNYADFYDIFGPTKFSRAGYAFSAKYHKTIRQMAPSKTDFFVKLTAFGDLETLPFYQNVASDYREMYVGTLNFHKSYLRKSLGAIEPEQGYDWNVFAYTTMAKESFYPQVISNFDLGFLLPLRNTSLWLRSSLGQSFGESDKSNSYFYFGGFGNNYLDYRSAQQYRDMSSFPGMEIDALSAMNYGKLAMDLNLKPLRFKRLGTKGFYSTYARFSLFGMGLFTNFENDQQQLNYYATGVQLDVELVLFTLLKSTLSFGVSRAFDAHISGDQYMVSLKL